MDVCLICALLAVSPALSTAQKNFEAGKIDDVYLALENQKLAADEKGPAAELLVRVSTSALEKKDGVMALSLAELALKQVPEHGGALEAAALASRNVEQFEQAEKYADRWIRLDTRSVPARLLRAELALEAADWQIAIDQLAGVKATGPLGDRVKSTSLRAKSELEDRKSRVTTVANLEKTVMEAAAEAKKQGRKGVFAAPPGKSAGGGVVVYSTSWCGYCRKVKAWLGKKGISYTERDIEKDPGAAEELAGKAAAAGVQPRGVPVIDARGTLVLGFDLARLEQLL